MKQIEQEQTASSSLFIRVPRHKHGHRGGEHEREKLSRGGGGAPRLLGKLPQSTGSDPSNPVAPTVHYQGASSSERSASELEPGAGRGKVLFFDAQSGAAGDMIVGALLDLGVPFRVVEEAVSSLSLSGVELESQPAMAGAIGACQFHVRITGAQPERDFEEIRAMLARSGLAEEVKDLAIRIFRRLAEAEAEVHRVPVEAVHFHEVGAVDAIADIVGAAQAFVYLGARVESSPLPLGRGFVECRHGRLPLPAPATVLCLRGVPTHAADVEAELVTPTGAAILATVAQSFPTWPALSPERVGWGKGTQTLPDRINALRLVLGTPASKEGPWGDRPVLTHAVIEANIDDMTGELTAHVMKQLLSAGALDVWVTQVTMKKGRPGVVLSALCEEPRHQQIAATLLKESTTIGVRVYRVQRHERPRRELLVQTPFGSVPVKVSEGEEWGAPRIKPEFDACVLLAEARGIPVEEVLRAALVSAMQALLP